MPSCPIRPIKHHRLRRGDGGQRLWLRRSNVDEADGAAYTAALASEVGGRPMRLRQLIGRAGARFAGVVVLCGAAASTASVHAAVTTATERSVLKAGPAISVFPRIRLPRIRPAAQPPGGYTPPPIRTAYSVKPLLRSGSNGKGTSIVIVDS